MAIEICSPSGLPQYVPDSGAWSYSTFAPAQLFPQYDEAVSWLHQGRYGQGAYSYYPEFTYATPKIVQSQLQDSGAGPSRKCGQLSLAGMGAVDPAQFEAHYGYAEPDAETCLRIQCGSITQDKAGLKLISDCANAGYAGVRSCRDPLCLPYCPAQQYSPGPTPPVLHRADIVAPMPSITTTADCAEVSRCGDAEGILKGCLTAVLVTAGIMALLGSK